MLVPRRHGPEHSFKNASSPRSRLFSRPHIGIGPVVMVEFILVDDAIVLSPRPGADACIKGRSRNHVQDAVEHFKTRLHVKLPWFCQTFCRRSQFPSFLGR